MVRSHCAQIFQQRALMTNAMAVTDQEHPDHQLGIDRGPADVAVKCRIIADSPAASQAGITVRSLLNPFLDRVDPEQTLSAINCSTPFTR